MAESGAVAWIFEPKGVIGVDLEAGIDADEVALAAIDGGMGVDAALESAYGFGIDELDAAWRGRLAR